jgi:hypothetical protein
MIKTNFSKFWHIFYCAVILVLSYLYYNAAWSTGHYNGIFETRNALRRSNESLEYQNGILLRGVEETAEDSGDTSNKEGMKAARDYTENSKIAEEYFREIRSGLIMNSGGYDKNYTDGRMVDMKYCFPSNNYFDKQKINELKRYLTKFDNDRTLIINNLDEHFSRDFRFSPIIADSTFWGRLEDCSPANALLKLEEIINNIRNDEQQALNHFYHKMGTSCMYCGQPNLVLLTEQINVENQEYLEGYVSLMDNAFICRTRNVEFFANGKKLPCEIGERGAYLKYKPTKKGKNKINLECRIKNPLTNAWHIAKSKVYFYAK